MMQGLTCDNDKNFGLGKIELGYHAVSHGSKGTER
jgi:hypothetical protein